MNRRLLWVIGGVLTVLLLFAVILPSMNRAREHALRSIAQSYFQRLERGDWPRRSGPCPSGVTASGVQACVLDVSDSSNSSVTFTLEGGRTVTFQRRDVMR